LYQRRKGRDLFDLYKAFSTHGINTENVILCYREYMNFAVDKPPSAKEYLQNMELKMQDDEFLGDTRLLLRPDELYSQTDAWELVKRIIEKF